MLIGFVALLFIMAMSLWLGERSQYFFNGALEARSTWNAVSDLRHSLQTAEASQRGYIVTGNQVYLAPYGTAKAQASRQLAAVDRLLQPVAEARQSLDRLKAIVSEKFAEMDRTIGLKRDRRDDEAQAIFRTNRGKALTDEANVFLSSMIRAADARLTEGVVEVRENALLLRLATILSGILIVLVMAGVIVTVVRYTRALASARDEVADPEHRSRAARRGAHRRACPGPRPCRAAARRGEPSRREQSRPRRIDGEPSGAFRPR